MTEPAAAAAPVVEADDPLRPDVLALLGEHLAELRATSPPESVHALEPDALAADGVRFLTARADGVLLGCGALVLRADGTAELKSMRTATAARGRGVADAVLTELLAVARRAGVDVVRLETGVEDLFAAARRLYARHGFTPCPPFGDYSADPNSVFLERGTAGRE